MSERTCKACHMPLRTHSIIQLKSCESLSHAQLNFQRMIKESEEHRKQLEMKLAKEPTTNKSSK